MRSISANSRKPSLRVDSALSVRFKRNAVVRLPLSQTQSSLLSGGILRGSFKRLTASCRTRFVVLRPLFLLRPHEVGVVQETFVSQAPLFFRHGSPNS
jgi:hypothetical protein